MLFRSEHGHAGVQEGGAICWGSVSIDPRRASQSRDDEESREDEMETEEERDEETEREMGPQRLRIHGEAQVPEQHKEPTTEDEKYLIVPSKKE